jgi:hypothetical protein
MKRRHRIAGGVTATLALAAGIWAVGVAPAQAAARDGICETGEFCYYYDNGTTGSVSDFTTSLANYGTTQPSCYEFRGAGNGKGLCIKNRAASAWNRSGQTVRVSFNSNNQGSYQDIAPGARVDLNATLRKENASHEFLSTHTQPPPVLPVPFPPYTPPPAECIPDAVYYLANAGAFPSFRAYAKCSSSVSRATLTMTVAKRGNGEDWSVRAYPIVTFDSPTSITYPDWPLFDKTTTVAAWALARVCWDTGQTTVCRDDYATMP